MLGSPARTRRSCSSVTRPGSRCINARQAWDWAKQAKGVRPALSTGALGPMGECSSSTRDKLSSSLTVRSWPCSAARCSGVRPTISTDLSRVTAAAGQPRRCSWGGRREYSAPAESRSPSSTMALAAWILQVPGAWLCSCVGVVKAALSPTLAGTSVQVAATIPRRTAATTSGSSLVQAACKKLWPSGTDGAYPQARTGKTACCFRTRSSSCCRAFRPPASFPLVSRTLRNT
mmetsp:Transcript_17961/g.52517  ORF Transcript_17961/g.52517 Transcript_17961/m.52517 type:complete len:232 (+) Transcript_17961:1038-1733(+)